MEELASEYEQLIHSYRRAGKQINGPDAGELVAVGERSFLLVAYS